MQLKFSNNSIKILFLLVSTDLVFFCLHIFYKCQEWGALNICKQFRFNELFAITTDLGYAEFFQYIKEFWIVVLLALVAWRNKSFLYLSWSLLFVYVLLDDSFGIHENLGDFISTKFSFIYALHLRAVDFGEIFVSAFFGTLFLILIAISYRFSKSIERKISRYLIVMLLALALAGIVADMLHMMFYMVGIEFMQRIFTFIEDGGEHLVMSVILGFVYSVSERTNQNLPVSRDNKILVSHL
jgi:hypothetical protein